jgi:hypothetical protein
MFKVGATALVFAGLIAGGLSEAAKADVVYDLTFDNSGGGTGTLTLNFATIADTYNIGYTSIAPFLVDVSATDVDGSNFNITPANLASGSAIQTGNTGQLYTLTVPEEEPSPPDSADTLFLDLYTNTWQIHGIYDSTIASGGLAVAGPFLAATPLPPSWTLMLVGLAGLGIVACYVGSRRPKAVPNLIADMQPQEALFL